MIHTNITPYGVTLCKSFLAWVKAFPASEPRILADLFCWETLSLQHSKSDPFWSDPRQVDLAIDYIEVGREDTARAEVAEALRLDPQLSLKNGFADQLLMDKDRVVVALSTAGLK